MVIDFAAFKKSRPKMQPVAVSIGGIDDPFLLHLFTMREMQKVMGGHPLIDACEESEKDEMTIRVQTLYFMNGIDALISEQSCEELTDLFSGWQLREIYMKALELNGAGPSALGEAIKN